MKQKTKSIIYLTLICFIFLLFLPTKAWSVNIDPPGGGGGGEECTRTCAKPLICPSSCPDKSTSSGCGAYWDAVNERCCAANCAECPEYKPEYCYYCHSSLWTCYKIADDAPYKTSSGCHSECMICCDIEKEECYCGSCSGHNYSTKSDCEEKCGGTTTITDAPEDTGTYLECRPPNTTVWGADPDALYCKIATWTGTDPGNECSKKNDFCRYSCNISTGCYEDFFNTSALYTALYKCEEDCTTQPPVSPPPVSPPPVSPPPVSPPPVWTPKCGIMEFSINGRTNEDRDPLYVWVDIFLKGRISTNAYCTKCTVESTDTWGNPNPVEYAMTLLSHYEIEENFKIPETGTYSFTVTCQGSDPDDIVVDNFSLKTVQAINLPWWREIIPVLSGFLRGIWR